jgi:hypothetical protein
MGGHNEDICFPYWSSSIGLWHTRPTPTIFAFDICCYWQQQHAISHCNYGSTQSTIVKQFVWIWIKFGLLG